MCTTKYRLSYLLINFIKINSSAVMQETLSPPYIKITDPDFPELIEGRLCI